MNKLYLKLFLILSLSILTIYNSSAQTVDNTFNPPTLIRAAAIKCMAVTLDGKTLLGGEIAFYKGKKVNNLIRLNGDGSIDESFQFVSDHTSTITELELLSTGEVVFLSNNVVGKVSATGKIVSTVTLDLYPSAMKVQEDDKILFAGYLPQSGESDLIRLNSDLTKDGAFNEALTIDSYVMAIALQYNRILIAGGFKHVNGLPKNGMARLNLDGSVDNNFDVGLGTEDYIGSLTVDANERIYIGNCYINRFNGYRMESPLVRLKANGAVDETFHPSRAIENVGKIVLVNNKVVLLDVFREEDQSLTDYVLSINETGTLDESFIKTELKGSFEALIIPCHDKFIVAGEFAQGKDYGVAMFKSNGEEITTFSPEVGRNGLVRTGVYSEGKLIVGGEFLMAGSLKTYSVARLNNDGTVDPNFKIDSNTGKVYRIAMTDGDKMLIATGEQFYKVDSKGTVDNSFKFIPFKNLYYVYDFMLDSARKIIAVGPNDLYRLNADGSEDLTFKMGDGITDGGRSTAFDFDITADHKILFGSAFTEFDHISTKKIVRLNPDGAVDRSFEIGTGPDGGNFINFIKILPNKEILVGGSFSSFNGVAALAGFVKLSENGKVDTTFSKLFPYQYFIAREAASFKKHILLVGYGGFSSIKYDGSLNSDFIFPWQAIGSGQAESLVKVSEKECYLLGANFGITENRSAVIRILMNDAPSITSTTLATTINEDETMDIAIAELDVDDDDNEEDLTIKIAGGNNYTAVGNKIIPHLNFSGELEISIVVNDGQLDSQPYTYKLTVLPENDKPVISGVKMPYVISTTQPLNIELDNFNITDPDDTKENFILKIGQGDHFSVNGNVIALLNSTPNKITIPIVVGDGKDDSEVYSLWWM